MDKIADTCSKLVLPCNLTFKDMLFKPVACPNTTFESSSLQFHTFSFQREIRRVERDAKGVRGDISQNRRFPNRCLIL